MTVYMFICLYVYKECVYNANERSTHEREVNMAALSGFQAKIALSPTGSWSRLGGGSPTIVTSH